MPDGRTPRRNELGQLIGEPIDGWVAPSRPPRRPLEGRWCRVEPIDPEVHADELFEAFARDREGGIWTYMPYGPFESSSEYRAWLEGYCTGTDPMFFAVRDTADSGRALGVASYCRINPTAGVIEVGHICYSPGLQRTTASTEAMYLMMRNAFELGYRRYEWKADSLNQESERAAVRLGFRFEGVFRQAIVYKGRNRDTRWLSVVDSEWPALKRRFETWLEPENFDARGRQRQALDADDGVLA